jgi:hypothetical protein
MLGLPLRFEKPLDCSSESKESLVFWLVADGAGSGAATPKNCATASQELLSLEGSCFGFAIGKSSCGSTATSSAADSSTADSSTADSSA